MRSDEDVAPSDANRDDGSPVDPERRSFLAGGAAVGGAALGKYDFLAGGGAVRSIAADVGTTAVTGSVRDVSDGTVSEYDVRAFDAGDGFRLLDETRSAGDGSFSLAVGDVAHEDVVVVATEPGHAAPLWFGAAQASTDPTDLTVTLDRQTLDRYSYLGPAGTTGPLGHATVWRRIHEGSACAQSLCIEVRGNGPEGSANGTVGSGNLGAFVPESAHVAYDDGEIRPELVADRGGGSAGLDLDAVVENLSAGDGSAGRGPLPLRPLVDRVEPDRYDPLEPDQRRQIVADDDFGDEALQAAVVVGGYAGTVLGGPVGATLLYAASAVSSWTALNDLFPSTAAASGSADFRTVGHGSVADLGHVGHDLVPITWPDWDEDPFAVAAEIPLEFSSPAVHDVGFEGVWQANATDDLPVLLEDDLQIDPGTRTPAASAEASRCAFSGGERLDRIAVDRGETRIATDHAVAERIGLRTTGSTPVDLDGVEVRDPAGSFSRSIDALEVPADGAARVYTGTPEEGGTDVTGLGLDRTVWEPSGDEVILHDPRNGRTRTLDVAEAGDPAHLAVAYEETRIGADGDGLERIALTHQGVYDVDLSGWTLENDDGTASFILPEGLVLRPTETLVVYTREAPAAPAGDRWIEMERDADFWTDGGDVIHLAGDEAGTEITVHPQRIAAFDVDQAASEIDVESATAEVVAFENDGVTPLSVGGWIVENEAGTDSFAVPDGATIDPGDRYVIHTGVPRDFDEADGVVSLERTREIWDDDGDVAHVTTSAGETLTRSIHPTQPSALTVDQAASRIAVDRPTAERVAFRNEAETPLAIGDWTVANDAGEEFGIPPDTVLGPGESFTVYTDLPVELPDDVPTTTLGLSGEFWADDGDVAHVTTPVGETLSLPVDGDASADLPLVYDLESGTLDRFEVGTFPGNHDSTFEVTESPAVGDYAVTHRTEARYLEPVADVSLEPPLTITFDVYVEGWSGIDLLVQYDAEAEVGYRCKVRNNADRKVIELEKVHGPVGDVTDGANDRRVDAGFATGEWETVEVTWREDGRLTATVLSSGRQVTLTDDELSGHPFRIVGYHYDGFAALDDLRIRADDDRSGAVITSFEDGTAADWVVTDSGSTGGGAFEVTTERPFEGEHALTYTGDRKTYAASVGGDLPYPERGDAFELRWYYPLEPNGNGGFGWAAQDERFDGGYQVDLRNDNWSSRPNTAALRRIENGQKHLLDSVDLPVSEYGDQYQRWVVEWGDPTITVTGYGEDGEEIVTLSADDETFDTGGIVCSANAPDPATHYFDAWKYVDGTGAAPPESGTPTEGAPDTPTQSPERPTATDRPTATEADEPGRGNADRGDRGITNRGGDADRGDVGPVFGGDPDAGDEPEGSGGGRRPSGTPSPGDRSSATPGEPSDGDGETGTDERRSATTEERTRTPPASGDRQGGLLGALVDFLANLF